MPAPIITEPGEYVTRAGQRVHIDTVDLTSPYTFPCKGRVTRKTKPLQTEWSIWKPNGQHKAVGTSQDDIIRKA